LLKENGAIFETQCRSTRSSNPEDSTLVPNMGIAHYWLF